jgi:hypothetical protein
MKQIMETIEKPAKIVKILGLKNDIYTLFSIILEKYSHFQALYHHSTTIL